MKRHTTLGSCAAIMLLTGGYGCADDALDLTKPTARAHASATASQAEAVTTERTALTTLTRAVALSLANDAFRTEVLQQMRNAPFKEHKLELRQYLNAGRLARISASSGKSAGELGSVLQTVRALEFYMPVAAQRESWTGDANLLVASQLDDGEEIVAFDLKGRQVILTEGSPPSVPTLAIVPVETRFNEPLDLAKWQNIDDRGGKAIGTMVSCAENPAACSPGTGNRNLEISKVIECGDCGGGDGGSYSSDYSGLYMTFSRLVDLGEPWTKGDPEIEVHIHGPQSGDDPRYGRNLACAAEGSDMPPYRSFDQNSVFWRGTPVLLFSVGQTARFNSEFPDGHEILFWEDDDTKCELKFDKDGFNSALGTTLGAIGAVAVKLIKNGPGWVGVASAFYGLWHDQASWLMSNDDYLGAAVTASSAGSNWSDANYTIMRAGDVNGRAMLQWIMR